MIKVRTPTCLFCGERSVVTIDGAAFERWVMGELAQDAFPDMPREDREILITGTHPACWDANMREDEEE